MNNFDNSLDRRQTHGDAATARNEEETLVADERATLRPSQIVEQKLIDTLRTSPCLVSQMQRRMKPDR